MRDNINERIIKHAAKLLHNGGIIALPTETSWIAACSSSSKEGIKKLRVLSGERDERHWTLLCSDISQFSALCVIDNRCFRVLNKYMPGPYVFILRTLHGTEKALGLRRSELGVRVSLHPVPRAVINALGTPLYTITAKRAMGTAADDELDAADGEQDDALPPIPESALFESGYELEEIQGIDMILDTGEELSRQFSTILDITKDEVRVLRRGAGEFPV